MTTELKPCPFCGGKSDMTQRGTTQVSTIYQCENCGCRLETGETFNHGHQWNTRATSSPVPELMRYGGKRYDNGMPAPGLRSMENGEYVLASEAERIIVDKDKEIERLSTINEHLCRSLGVSNVDGDRLQRRAEAAEAKLAILKAKEASHDPR